MTIPGRLGSRTRSEQVWVVSAREVDQRLSRVAPCIKDQRERSGWSLFSLRSG